MLNGKNLNKNNSNGGGGGGKGGSGKAESGGMVSRRRILSRSRDDLHMSNGNEEEQQQNGGHNGHNNGGMRGHPMRNVANYFRDEEDVWYLKEKLYRVSERTKIIQKNDLLYRVTIPVVNVN